MREKVDCLVIGAGVVGLAVARRLALCGRSVLVVEAQATIGSGASSRNSEVIHAGIYYPPGSLKATLCVEGRRALYAYCAERAVPYRRLGKLIVATAPQQLAALARLESIGKQNGVYHLRMLSAVQATRLEPQLRCVGALWSPCTGILDSHAYMLSLQAAAEEAGATFAFNAMVRGGAAAQGGVYVSVQDAGGGGLELAAKYVVNCAGAHAQAVASSIRGVRAGSVPQSLLAKGNYFRVADSRVAEFSRLVYPVPEVGGLGVHLTLDMAGKMRFGPDVEWMPTQGHQLDITTRLDYSVDPTRADKFYAEIRKYYPALADGCLVPDYAGIRSKLSAAGSDFLIQNKIGHGVYGLLNLFGIESPGGRVKAERRPITLLSRHATGNLLVTKIIANMLP